MYEAYDICRNAKRHCSFRGRLKLKNIHLKTNFQGTMGTKFYVIIKGSVSVNVRFLANPEEKREESAKLQNLTSSTLPVEYILKEIKVLNAGLAFGELSLIENKPRAATIICVEDCGFAVLDKKNFDLILSKK